MGAVLLLRHAGAADLLHDQGFLGYGDGDAYTVYGAYTALVYMTPFFGGLLADRLLGARKAVVFGGCSWRRDRPC